MPSHSATLNARTHFQRFAFGADLAGSLAILLLASSEVGESATLPEQHSARDVGGLEHVANLDLALLDRFDEQHVFEAGCFSS